MLQVLAARQRFALIGLSKIYTALTLSVVAQLPAMAGLSPADIQQYVHNLIAMGSLPATLTPDPDPAQSVLRFHSPDGAREDVDAEAQLVDAKARIAALDRHMQIAQRRMEITKEYVEAERRVRKTRPEATDTAAGAERFLPGPMDYQDEEALEDM